MATVLGPDMLTIVEEPVFVAPSGPYSKGSGFEGHEFFEAPSIRKKGDTYYLVYSSIVMHELCYATSKFPTKGFVYQGVVVSNNDLHIDSYKPADKPRITSYNVCYTKLLRGGSRMRHIFQKGSDTKAPVLLLLHGTGGNDVITSYSIHYTKLYENRIIERCQCYKEARPRIARYPTSFSFYLTLFLLK